MSTREHPAPIGESVARPRASRLLAGRGRYTDDITLPRMAHAAFVRSPHPHARIAALEWTAAQQSPGVLRIVDGKEIAQHCLPYAGIHQLFPGMRAPEQLPLVVDRACWQGEPVVAVVAATRAEAEDAADLVVVEWEPLEAVKDAREAMAKETAIIHDGLGSNVAYQGTVSHGNLADTFSRAALVVEGEFRFARHTGVCLEPRSIIADYNPSEESLTVHQSHQCPAQQQDIYARLLSIPEHKVRIVCPDVGGAYGIKQQLYGDELAVCILSKLLKRPIKFIADRIESFSTDIHARDHIVTGRLAVASDGRFVGLDVDDFFGIGAYSQYPRSSIGEGSHVLRMCGAPYAFDAYRCRLSMVLQNKNMIGHYRSVGHPIAVAVAESLVDLAARKLGLDPVEIRRRNYIPADAYPFASHGGFIFDRLSQHECLERLVRAMNLPKLRADQEASRRGGRYRGIGLASFVELTGTGPEYYGKGEVRVSAQDGCFLKLESSGKLRCITSVTEQGQGADTAVAQVVAGVIGVPLADVAVICGDTESSPYGSGAWASRGASVGCETALRTAEALKRNILEIAGHVLQAQAVSLTIRNGAILDAAGRERMTLADVARIGYFRQDLLPAEMQPELSVVRHYTPRDRPFIITNGIHGSWVEVDAQTGFVRLLGHFVVHDPGTMINPLLVEEQIRGGVVQGLGAALYEEILYGSEGELLTGSMADYLVPMSMEMPDIVVEHVSGPGVSSGLGAKGVGEAGTAGASAAVLNAVNDALAPLGAQLTEIPLTPQRILRALGRIS